MAKTSITGKIWQKLAKSRKQAKIAQMAIPGTKEIKGKINEISEKL